MSKKKKKEPTTPPNSSPDPSVELRRLFDLLNGEDEAQALDALRQARTLLGGFSLSFTALIEKIKAANGLISNRLAGAFSLLDTPEGEEAALQAARSLSGSDKVPFARLLDFLDAQGTAPDYVKALEEKLAAFAAANEELSKQNEKLRAKRKGKGPAPSEAPEESPQPEEPVPPPKPATEEGRLLDTLLEKATRCFSDKGKELRNCLDYAQEILTDSPEAMREAGVNLARFLGKHFYHYAEKNAFLAFLKKRKDIPFDDDCLVALVFNSARSSHETASSYSLGLAEHILRGAPERHALLREPMARLLEAHPQQDVDSFLAFLDETTPAFFDNDVLVALLASLRPINHREDIFPRRLALVEKLVQREDIPLDNLGLPLARLVLEGEKHDLILPFLHRVFERDKKIIDGPSLAEALDKLDSNAFEKGKESDLLVDRILLILDANPEAIDALGPACLKIYFNSNNAPAAQTFLNECFKRKKDFWTPMEVEEVIKNAAKDCNPASDWDIENVEKHFAFVRKILAQNEDYGAEILPTIVNLVPEWGHVDALRLLWAAARGKKTPARSLSAPKAAPE